MSRKHRQAQRPRSSVAWPIIAFGAILIVGAALLLTRHGDAATAAEGGPAGGGTPRIVIDQPKIDYGYVKFGETRTFKLAITNDGDAPLRFNSKPYIEVLEGC